jgi:hypothetical protein
MLGDALCQGERSVGVDCDFLNSTVSLTAQAAKPLAPLSAPVNPKKLRSPDLIASQVLVRPSHPTHQPFHQLQQIIQPSL